MMQHFSQQQLAYFFNVLLTVHLSITLVNDQLDAQLLYFIIRLLQSSTCFEQRHAHHQEVSCTNTASGIVTLCKWPSSMQVSTCIPDSHLQRMTIPDAVLIQFDFLMMSTTLLETCRGL
jgi:hypothetical protein